jgi:CheY-like chemotaxis protein
MPDMMQERFDNNDYPGMTDYSGNGEGIRVVAVDDEPDVIDTIVQLMQDCGFEIVGETDPATAISTVMNLKPDVIILDLMMPGMDGYEFARRISAEEETKEIPIVYLTSKGIKNDLCKSFARGGTMYVKKPFLAQELADSLRIAVSLARAV